MVILDLATGLRCSELFALKWCDVIWDDLRLLVRRGIVDNFSWIKHTGLDQVAELPSLCVEAEVLISRLTHAAYNYRAFAPSVFRDLAHGFFELALSDVHADGFLVVEFELL